MEPLILGAALAAGGGLAALAIWAARRYAKADDADEPVELEIVIEEDAPVTFVPPRPAAAPAPAAPPPSTPKSHPARAPAMVLTQGVQMHDEAFSRHAGAGRAPARNPPPAAPPAAPYVPRVAPTKSWAQEVMERAPPEVPTEWARRQVGPVEPGRTAGACGGCGARLSVSNERPLRIACPVCGRTKLLAS